MLKVVIYDLRIFMFFYGILIVMFAQVFSVLGLGNDYTPDIDDGNSPTLLLRLLKAKAKASGGGSSEEFVDTTAVVRLDPAKDYRSLGLALGEVMWVLRLSLGDGAAIEASKLLD